ncbi:MAG: hypothetical protein K2N71_02815, partial [Oscillospiraceae bacterium]|nr:hypothetical protein [Oscillospiraceae bacterium]
DPQCSVYIDTSKNKIRSCEIIKIADITYMCGVTRADLVGYPRTNENLDRSNFTDMIVGLGYDKEKAEFMYDGMKEFIAILKGYNKDSISVITEEGDREIKLSDTAFVKLFDDDDDELFKDDE